MNKRQKLEEWFKKVDELVRQTLSGQYLIQGSK